jgi:glycosyltransferase involved in cell wall biosynthesis/putative flippase GtrA
MMGYVRIAIVTEVWSPTVNGVVTRLSATITELRAAGHDVLVICPSVEGCDESTEPGGPGTPPHLRRGGLSVRTVPTIRVRFVYGGEPWGLPAPRVRRHLAEFCPDVVHVANPVSLGVAGVWAARRLRAALVCSYHTDIAAYAGHYHLGWLRPVIRAHLRRLHRDAAINLATSSAAGQQLRQMGIGCRPDEYGAVTLWPRGVDLDKFCIAEPLTSDPLTPPATGAPRPPYRALYVGRLADEKRIGDLAALARDPAFELTVVGDGPARHDLEARLGPTAIFTGTRRGSDLAAVYRSADLFVFPSVTETLGLVILEALASGLPVVAADSPASKELLAHCDAARLWPDGGCSQLPALAGELLESAPRAQLAAWARAEVDGRTWCAATAQLLEHYQQARTMAATWRPRALSAAQQFRRFALIGGSNALIDLGLFNLLLAVAPTRSATTIAAYNTVAVVAALANSYWCNSRWTFRHQPITQARRPWLRRGLFVAQGALNLAINDAVVVAGTHLFRSTHLVGSALANNTSKVAALIVASTVSFVALRNVVFSEAAPRPVTAAERWRPARWRANQGPSRSEVGTLTR